jgi:hypothetical protein
LAAGQTLRNAAAAAGVGERTASRRWADPEFRRRLERLRADMLERALGKLADARAGAAETLRRLLNAHSESVRLAAARSILELGAMLGEMVELDRDVTELMERVGLKEGCE